MKKSLCYFIFAGLLIFAGCGNSNMFSWAHDEGSGDYESLMIDAEAAMKDKSYAKAARYYAKAINKKPGDPSAIYGYSSAAVADATKSAYHEIINAVISDSGYSSVGLLSFLNIKETEKLQRALEDILRPNMLPSILNTAENKVDINLNASISYLLLAAVSIMNDPAIDLNDLNINADFSITVENAVSAAQAVKDAVNGYILPNLAKSQAALANISSEGGSVSSELKEEIDGLVQDINTKGYFL